MYSILWAWEGLGKCGFFSFCRGKEQLNRSAGIEHTNPWHDYNLRREGRQREEKKIWEMWEGKEQLTEKKKRRGMIWKQEKGNTGSWKDSGWCGEDEVSNHGYLNGGRGKEEWGGWSGEPLGGAGRGCILPWVCRVLLRETGVALFLIFLQEKLAVLWANSISSPSQSPAK